MGTKSGYVVAVGLLSLLLLGSPLQGALLTRPIRYPPGIPAPEAPLQSSTPPEHWVRGDYRFSAVARYELRGRMIKSHEYWFDRESKIAPLDFTMAWSKASDQSVQDAISVSLWGRYYRWSAQSANLPVSAQTISENMANMHLIPSSPAVLKELRNVSRGSLVTLKGYLVNVEADDGYRWTSSLSRRDSGPGACELMWVESVE